MKKLFIVLFVALLCLDANAQFFGGLAFDIGYSSNSTLNNLNVRHWDNESYNVSIAPQFGWMTTEKLMVGASVSFDMTNTNRMQQISGDMFGGGIFGDLLGLLGGDDSDFDGFDPEDLGLDGSEDFDGQDLSPEDMADLEGIMSELLGQGFLENHRSICLSIAPFSRYNVGEFGRFGIWMEGHLYLGMNFPDPEDVGGLFNRAARSVNYGVQVSPMVSFKFNERMLITLHFSTLSLGWAGSTEWMPDDTVRYSSDLRMFSGKIDGLLSSAVTDSWYGFRIGTVYKF